MPRKKKPTGLKKVTHHYRRAWTNPFFKGLNVVLFAAVFAWLGHYFFPSHAVTYPYEKPGLASGDFGPTKQQREVHALFKQQLAGLRKRLDDVLNQDLTAVNKLLADSGNKTVIKSTP